ncbi:hypothetical protein ACYRFF_02340 [Listeria welshimeri]|uniref:Uncharacterized protein n=1 Tax=Listeria welshimeri TaxID=1643 RepID=A0ABX4II40_LISWE|nr:hypothetical protein [Listeria welshimeri]PDK42584.1 hypothetical protein AFZ32_01790 [Listeria welshimeri]
MAYKIPSYIPKTDSKINYSWDDNMIDEMLDYDYAKSVCDKLLNISLRAKIALNIGVYELVLAYLGELSDKAEPYQVVEAAWCANINKYYIYYIEFDHNEYIGPIDGPLWCGLTSVVLSLYVSENIADVENLDKYEYEDQQLYGGNDDYAEIGLMGNISLALYILPDNQTQLFKKWFENISERFIQLYFMPEEDEYSNLFGYNSEKDWLGDYVPREALDSKKNYQPSEARLLSKDFLQDVDYKENPYLVPPEELIGRVKKPYDFIPEI